MRSAILLAGGKSTRMGKEKALIPFNGRPLVLWVWDVLSQVSDEILVSVSPTPSERLINILGPSATIVMDEEPGLGPIGGLLSSFKKVNGEYAAVGPCDAPLIDGRLYELLFEKAKGRGGAVPLVGGFYEPLIAVYRREPFIEALERVVREGKTKPIDTYPHLDLSYVDESDLRRVDLTPEMFRNINLAEDIEVAEIIN